jgi:hypothetical protein
MGQPEEAPECSVTGSVAVGTPRDGQDTTGRKSIIEPYLTPRADFTKEFANSTKRSIRFQVHHVTSSASAVTTRLTSSHASAVRASSDELIDTQVRLSQEPCRQGSKACRGCRTVLGQRPNFRPTEPLQHLSAWP